MSSFCFTEDFLFVRRTPDKKLRGGALFSVPASSYKRMSSFFSASMTVEACLVLPLFMFAFLNIMSIMEIYRIQGDMSAAIHDTEKSMAVYAYEYKEIAGSDKGKAVSLGLTYAYAATKVKDKLGSLYPDDTLWIRSSVLEEDECIDLIAEYTISPLIEVMDFGKLHMYNRLRTRAWTGYDNAAASGDTGDETVYITESGTVYHKSRACTYLKLSVKALDAKSLESERSLDGSKYYGCEECGSKSEGTVYITNYGNRYHTTLGCSKLKRTIKAIPLSEAGGKSACSKCG